MRGNKEIFVCPTHGPGVRVYEPHGDRVYCADCGKPCTTTLGRQEPEEEFKPHLTVTVSGGCSAGLHKVCDALEEKLKELGFEDVRVKGPEFWPWPWDGMTKGERVLVRVGDPDA